MSSKILYTKGTDKWHVHIVPTQISLIRVYTVYHSSKIFKKQLHESKNFPLNYGMKHSKFSYIYSFDQRILKDWCVVIGIGYTW